MGGRSRTAREPPFKGFLRPSWAGFRLARVEQVDEEARTIAVSWMSGEGGHPEVGLSSSVGEFGLPSEGDVAVVVKDQVERPLCIGFIEEAYIPKREKGALRRTRKGERYIQSDFGSRLVMNQQGEVLLQNAENAGLTTNRKSGEVGMHYRRSEMRGTGQLLDPIGNDPDCVVGIGEAVRSAVLGFLGERTPLPSITNPAVRVKEFFVEVKDTLAGLPVRVGRLVFGTEVRDEAGIPETDPKSIMPLRAKWELRSSLDQIIWQLTVDDGGRSRLGGTTLIPATERMVLGNSLNSLLSDIVTILSALLDGTLAPVTVGPVVLSDGIPLPPGPLAAALATVIVRLNATVRDPGSIADEGISSILSSKHFVSG